MEWMNRNNRPSQPIAGQQQVGVPQSVGLIQNQIQKVPNILRWANGALLIAGAILLLAVVSWLAFANNNPNSEARFVDTSKMQAVFLNGGQVYFGKISTLNNKYVGLDDIYYLRVNQQVQPNQASATSSQNDVSLVKLGCELHGPQDRMLINREQVIFWENLKEDGQVAQAVAKYKQDNPNGQKCEQPADTTTNTQSQTQSQTNTSNTNSTSNSNNSRN